MSPLEWRAGPNAHLLVGDLPAQPRFDGRPWEGTGVSIAAHLCCSLLAYPQSSVAW